MSYDQPPAKPFMAELCVSLYLYSPEDLEMMERLGHGTVTRRAVTRYARWWLPLPSKGDEIGIGDDPEYFRVAHLEWWPTDSAVLIHTEPIRTDDVDTFHRYLAVLSGDGWLTEHEWFARQEASA